ncbi:MAG TPA: ferredoxin [Bacteriovoracaceae bacterium]|nr:ferredoxin [Bacteriovoracaceae bacterium]
MSTSLIAMGIALFLVINLVVGLAVTSLFFGAFETLFGKPKFTFLKSVQSGNMFAFGFKWNSAKEPAKMDFVKIRMFNPFGKPTQMEVTQNFDGFSSSFATEVDMGPGLINLLGQNNFENSSVMIEVGSAKDGISFQFNMKGTKFRKLIAEAELTVSDYKEKHKLDAPKVSKPPIDIPVRSFIADTVPGKGPALKIATNPIFAGDFAAAAAGAGGGAAAAEAAPTFPISKVWIEPGCIVCNACEDIYPEVFEVTSDTCLIRPNAPLDDGLRVQEAAEACPVEVIKFTKA